MRLNAPERRTMTCVAPAMGHGVGRTLYKTASRFGMTNTARTHRSTDRERRSPTWGDVRGVCRAEAARMT